MKIYLVRHGQVPHNATKQYNVGDEDLTEVGVEQATMVGGARTKGATYVPQPKEAAHE